ncbi:Auxin-induced protein X10A, partial [Trichuris trichiura]
MGHFPETIERGSDRLLVFFTGWGMDWHATRHLSLDGFDLVVLYDYTHPVQWSLPCGYSEYHLAAWSLGVWAAAEWCM